MVSQVSKSTHFKFVLIKTNVAEPNQIFERLLFGRGLYDRYVLENF